MALPRSSQGGGEVGGTGVCDCSPPLLGLEMYFLEPTPKCKSFPEGVAKGLAPSASAVTKRPESLCPSISMGTLRLGEGKWLALTQCFSHFDTHMNLLESLLNVY